MIPSVLVEQIGVILGRDHTLTTHSFESERNIVDMIRTAFQRRFDSHNPYHDTCIIDLLQLFNGSYDTVCRELFDMLLFAKPTMVGVSRICELMRGGGSKCLPLRIHAKLFEVLGEALTRDCPPHIKLCGDAKTYIQFPSQSLICPNGYTLTCWINFEELPSVEGCLFKCRTSEGEIEALLLQVAHDEHCTAIVRITFDRTQNRNRLSQEVRGHILLPVNKWVLFSIQHSPNAVFGTANLIVAVDDVPFIETSLKYPFDISHSESMWLCGLGLRMSLSCLAFYSCILPREMLKMIHELGPEVNSLESGVCVPQSSFDTGHTTLGVQLVKGDLAYEYCKTNPLFRFCAHHFASDALLPKAAIGRIKPEHIEMTSRYADVDVGNLPFVHGSVHISLIQSWKSAWLGIGGSSVILYLLSDYCSLRSLSICDGGQTKLNVRSIVIDECIHGCMLLLGRLLSLSIDLRDHFIQKHGFHVISHCLNRLDPSRLSCNTVDLCIGLTQSMGVDSLRGDGITSALQGLLMNFRLWGSANTKTRTYLLTQVYRLISHTPRLLYRGIGTQKILDIMVFNAGQSGGGIELCDLVSINDAGYSLLAAVLEGALEYFDTDQGLQLPDVEYMVLALDDVRDSGIAEHILRVLQVLFHARPDSLYRTLCDTRYAETTALHLLCDGTFSTKARTIALMFTLWTLKENLGSAPEQILAIFNDLQCSFRSDKDSSGAKKRKDMLAQVRRLMRPVEKSWLISNMLSKKFNASFNDNNWSDVNYLTSTLKEFLSLLNDNGSLGGVSCCVTLPLLSAFLPHVDLSHRQESLMSLAVVLKTNDAHVATMSLLPDISYVQQFLSLALASSNVKECQDHQWTNVRSFGDSASSVDVMDVVNTCFEISVDALSQILVFKIRNQGLYAWDTFTTIISCLRFDYASTVEDKCMKRISSLCLQKLARNRDNWNVDMMESISQLLLLVDDRMFCGNGRLPQSRQDVDLLDMHESCFRLQDDDEKQILCFVMDMLNTLCRAGDASNFGTTDAKVIIAGMKIMSSCLLCVDDDVGNRLCNDLQVLLCYATERWRYMQADVFKDIVLGLLNKFRHAIHDSSLSEVLRRRYSSAVVVLVDYFTRLPYGSFVPPQTLLLVEILSVAENVHDIDSIFMLLHIHLHEADSEAICFEEEDDGVVAVSHQKDVNAPIDFITPSIDDVNDTHPDSLNMSNKDIIGLNSDVYHVVEYKSGADLPVLTDANHISESPPDTSCDCNAFEQERKHKDAFYMKWIEVRYGIIQDRVDSERSRIVRTSEAGDFATEAAQKFWKTQRRKIETEVFYDEHRCEWKLGIAHEGYFPSRKRIVLRPRYESDSFRDSKLGVVKETHHANSMSEAELRLALTRAAAGQMVVGQGENISDDAEPKILQKTTNGWGVVDADGSEEGYGVVGLSQEYNACDNEAEFENDKFPNDITGDMREIEEGVKYGRDVETGPCHSGTRRITSGPTLHEAEVMLVTASGNCVGTLSFTTKDIFFVSSNDLESSHLDDPASVSLLSRRKVRRRRWTISTICAVYLRRFRHRNSALEVFFHRGKHRNFFVDFGYTKADAKRRNEFAKELMLIAPRQALKQWPGMSTYRMVSEHGVQERWLNGELSNFDYLMALNTIAGRTYNDLSQYPVMPWILSQYSEPTIDLLDPRSFRDLSRPVGALNEERLKEFVNRYNTFNDPDIPPFMYGSHYSTMVGVVLHYLVRLQPFASLHMDIQNGRFDVSDRLFSSIPRTWEHNTSMLSEVKELTPEWFTLPDFLRNINGFDFGQMQDESFVDDVDLPPWAVTPEEFIRINREALESPYVSAHLHEWIDLIFGYKQRGPPAVEANNIFYFLTYHESINHDVLVDEATRRAIELQIAHFGQCPTQLFRNAHPMKRKTAIPRLLKQCFDMRNGGFVRPSSMDEFLALNCECTLIHRVNGINVCNISISNEKFLCVLENGVLESFCFGLSVAAKTFLAEQIRATNNSASKNRQTIGPIGGSDDGLISFVENESSCSVSDGNFNELLLSVDKDVAHFDVIPRIPLSFRPTSCGVDTLCSRIYTSQSGKHIFSFGRLDGGIAVREVDVKSARVVSAADYCAHRALVCCLATDEIPGGATDAVVSSDVTGRILVWTVSRIHKKIGQRCIISRRPQREFHCHEDSHVWCDISWQLGVVVAGSRGLIHIFSIERDEKLRIIDVSSDVGKHRMPVGRSYRLWNLETSMLIKRGVISDDGILVIHVNSLNDGKSKEYLAAYTVSGQSVGIMETANVTTYLCCPAKGAVVLSGHADGSILIFNASNLELLCEWKPHLLCKTLLFGGRKGLVRPEPFEAAIRCVAVGPNARRPSIIVATTASGAIYVRALPDYIKWEKTRAVSALSQFVSGPMQAVKGTIMQASDAAGALATNAKSFAGEALAKMNKSKLFKNMGTMFGGPK